MMSQLRVFVLICYLFIGLAFIPTSDLKAQNLKTESLLREAGELIYSDPDSSLALVALIEEKHPPTDNIDRATLYNIKGWANRHTGNWQEAALHLGEAKKYAIDGGSDELLAEIYSRLSYVTLYAVSVQEGLRLSKEYYRLAEALNDSFIIADASDILFQAYRQLGDYEEGAPYVRKLLQIRLEQDDQDRRASAHNLMAIYHSETGNFSDAIFHFNKAIEIARRYNLKNRLYSPLNELGWLYFNSEEYEKAIQTSSELYNLAFESGNTERMLGAIYILNLCYMEQGILDEAEKWLSQGLKLAQQSDRAESTFIIYRDLANLFFKKSSYSESENYFKAALNIADENPGIYRGYLLNSYSSLKLKMGAPDEAVRLARLSYKESKGRNLDREFSSLRTLSQTFYAQGSDSAFFYADLAIRLFDEALRNQMTSTSRSRLSALSDFINRVALWHWEKREDAQAAFSFSEQAKARSLSRALLQRKENLLEQSNPDLLRQQDELVRDLNRLYAEKRASEAPDSLSSLIQSLELKREALEVEISASLRGGLSSLPKPYSINDVQSLLDEESMMLEFTISSAGILTFLIEKNRVRVHSVVSDSTNIEKDLQRLVNTYRTLIKDLAEPARLETVSDQIIALLFPDGFMDGQTPSKLIIVPDASLAYLPFSALIHNSRYLIEDHYIKLLPSASILPLIPEPGRIFRNTFFGYANSDFSYADNSNASRSAWLAPLPFAELEVENISSEFNFSYISDKSVQTEKELSYRLGNYKFIHFATHGVINEASPDFSKLILTNRLLNNNSLDDGHLTAAEISTLDLNADLVVLSACDTGLGKIVRGEGVLGMQRAFLIAGASSVVVSLWEVLDQSTATFMDFYYEKLTDNYEAEMSLADKALAFFKAYESPLFDYKVISMRDAKLEMLEHPYYNHPAYWAPFVYTGR